MITRPALGSSNSVAIIRSARCSGTCARIRPTRRIKDGRINSGAPDVVAGIACSKLACAEIMSRNDSVQMTSASSESIRRLSTAAPPNKTGHKATSAAPAPAATGHPAPNARHDQYPAQPHPQAQQDRGQRVDDHRDVS